MVATTACISLKASNDNVLWQIVPPAPFFDMVQIDPVNRRQTAAGKGRET